jgi:uncharacterized membrane protein YphA (DoxX/SURF4 family)
VSALARWDASGIPLVIARRAGGAAFVVRGALMVNDPVAFLKLVRTYDMVPAEPTWMLNGIAATLPWLEIWCGVLLLAGLWIRGAATVLLVMLAVFTVALTRRALAIQDTDQLAFCAIAFDCGCGTGEVNICRKLTENAGLVLASCVALVSRSRRWCLSSRI